MKASFVLILTALFSLNHASEPSLSFIANGEDAMVGEFPHQLIIQRTNMNTPWTYFGAGVLINKHQAITAAHVVVNDSVTYRVVAGLHNLTKVEEGQVAIFKHVQLHPSYRRKKVPPFLYKDIAVITFAEPLELNDRVQPIAWNQDASFPAVGDSCVLSGWGSSKKWNYTQPEILQRLSTKIISNKACNERLAENLLSVHDGHICMEDGETGSTSGDSGGPMTCQLDGKPILAGICSWKSIEEYGPSIYSRLSYYTEFLQDNIKA